MRFWRAVSLVVFLLSPSWAAERLIDSSVGKSPFVGDIGNFIDHASTALDQPIVFPDEKPPRSNRTPTDLAAKNFFYIYSDRRVSVNHFIPSGWMGDYDDLRMDDASREDPADGKTCIKITYQARVSNGYAWAGMYWQTPENNWGDKPGGYDLTGMKRLTFWARGAAGGEIISEFRVGGTQGHYADSGLARIGPITLTKEWHKYQIDLTDSDLSHIIGGFAWSASYLNNQEGLTFYLDEIRFER